MSIKHVRHIDDILFVISEKTHALKILTELQLEWLEDITTHVIDNERSKNYLSSLE